MTVFILEPPQPQSATRAAGISLQVERSTEGEDDVENISVTLECAQNRNAYFIALAPGERQLSISKSSPDHHFEVKGQSYGVPAFAKFCISNINAFGHGEISSGAAFHHLGSSVRGRECRCVLATDRARAWDQVLDLEF